MKQKLFMVMWGEEGKTTLAEINKLLETGARVVNMSASTGGGKVQTPVWLVLIEEPPTPTERRELNLPPMR